MQPSLRILLVEDREEEAHLLLTKLRRATLDGPVLDIVRAESLAAAQLSVQGIRPDVILLDLGLPDAQGTEAFHALVVHGVPIVIHSVMGDRDVAVECVQEGAQDFIHKNGHSGEEMLRALLFAVVRHAPADHRRRGRMAAFAQRIGELV